MKCPSVAVWTPRPNALPVRRDGGPGFGRQRKGRGLLLQQVETERAERQQRERQEEEDSPGLIKE